MTLICALTGFVRCITILTAQRIIRMHRHPVSSRFEMIHPKRMWIAFGHSLLKLFVDPFVELIAVCSCTRFKSVIDFLRVSDKTC
jgi:hypothetical protein